MGVPQTRHRVFFIAIRDDVDFDLYSLNMDFDYLPITYKDIKDGNLTPLKEDSKFYNIAKLAIDSDKNIADTRIRIGDGRSAFQTLYIRDNDIFPTIRAKPDIIDIAKLSQVSKETYRNAQTFPQDFDFIANSTTNWGYVCGMSVPPVMIKRIMQRLIESGLFKYKLGDR